MRMYVCSGEKNCGGENTVSQAMAVLKGSCVLLRNASRSSE